MLQGSTSTPGRCADRPAQALALILSCPSVHQMEVRRVPGEEMAQGRLFALVPSQGGSGYSLGGREFPCLWSHPALNLGAFTQKVITTSRPKL